MILMIGELLTELELKKRQQLQGDIEDAKGDNGWGNQIRSYVMQPYTMVKDHRTNVEIGNVSSVLDGNIDLFMNAYLKEQNKEAHHGKQNFVPWC